MQGSIRGGVFRGSCIGGVCREVGCVELTAPPRPPRIDPQVLNVSTNSLSSLDSLADACVALSELYVADNALVSLQGLHTKAPNLETLVRREGVCGGEEVRAVDKGT